MYDNSLLNTYSHVYAYCDGNRPHDCASFLNLPFVFNFMFGLITCKHSVLQNINSSGMNNVHDVNFVLEFEL